MESLCKENDGLVDDKWRIHRNKRDTNIVSNGEFTNDIIENEDLYENGEDIAYP